MLKHFLLGLFSLMVVVCMTRSLVADTKPELTVSDPIKVYEYDRSTILTERVDAYELINNDYKVDMLKNDNHNEYYHINGTSIIRSESLYVEYFDDNNKQWSRIGTPVMKGAYDNTFWRYYSDGGGITYNVTYDVGADGVTKVTLSFNDDNKNNYEYRVHWYIEGLPYTDYDDDNGKVYYDDLIISYDDVIKYWGDITEYHHELLLKEGLLIADYYFYVGTQNTFLLDPAISVVNSGGNADNGLGLVHHLQYNPNNDRWYMLYGDANSDVAVISAPASDTTSWGNITVIKAGTYGYPDMDMIIDIRDSSTAYMHIVHSSFSSDSIEYNRCLLNETAPYIFCSAEEIIYDASTMGESSSDDATFPQIGIDGNNCLVVLFDFEDDSEATNDEHEVVLTKEDAGTTCGDGDWDAAADTETGFPIYSVQDALGTGEASFYHLGITNRGAGDDFIIMYHGISSPAPMYAKYFYGGNNSLGSEILIESDAEVDNDESAIGMVFFNSTRTVFFNRDDGNDGVDLDAYLLDGNSVSDQVDTGIDVNYKYGAESGKAVAITDNNSDNNIWVFGVDENDEDDIVYANSTDGGATWSSPVTWQDNQPSGSDPNSELVAGYDHEHCLIMLRWVQSASPYTIYVDVLNISNGTCGGGGEPPVDSCTYDVGDWIVDISDNCYVTENTTVYPNSLIIIGDDGSFRVAPDAWVRTGAVRLKPDDFDGGFLYQKWGVYVLP